MNTNKKPLLSKILAVLGAVIGLLAAATPGVIEYLDKSEDHAQAQAQKSEELTELAYEKIRLELVYIHEQVKELKENDRAKNKLLAEMLLERARMAPGRQPASVVRSHRFRQVHGEEGDLEGLTLDEPQEAADAFMGEAEELEFPIQQLPENLEDEWKKGKK